jgi:hypothetical protein
MPPDEELIAAMRSDAETVDEYLQSLPEDRRQALTTVRDVILRNLPEGYEEGMIGYYVPLSRYPDTYNGQPLAYAGVASQKNYMSIYLMGVYSSEATEQWFREEYKKSGKKLNMGKSCVRFKKLEDLPIDLIGEAVARESVDDFIQQYGESRK